MAAVDILYIDITRRWNSVTLDQRDSGTWCLASTRPWGVQTSGQSIFWSFLLRIKAGEEGRLFYQLEVNLHSGAPSAARLCPPKF